MSILISSLETSHTVLCRSHFIINWSYDITHTPCHPNTSSCHTANLFDIFTQSVQSDEICNSCVFRLTWSTPCWTRTVMRTSAPGSSTRSSSSGGTPEASRRVPSPCQWAASGSKRSPQPQPQIYLRRMRKKLSNTKQQKLSFERSNFW